jgi:CheY-like chemotaxis protein
MALELRSRMKTIMLVEDDQITAHVYRKCLESAGYQVQVSDAQGCFDRIAEVNPAGLLVDLMMPKISGFDVLRRLRALPQFANLPIMVYTNAFIPKMVQDATKAGATRVFDKSTLTPETLAEAFRTTIPETGP